jgi:hypothetical protein
MRPTLSRICIATTDRDGRSNPAVRDPIVIGESFMRQPDLVRYERRRFLATVGGFAAGALSAAFARGDSTSAAAATQGSIFVVRKSRMLQFENASNKIASTTAAVNKWPGSISAGPRSQSPSWRTNFVKRDSRSRGSAFASAPVPGTSGVSIAESRVLPSPSRNCGTHEASATRRSGRQNPAEPRAFHERSSFQIGVQVT